MKFEEQFPSLKEEYYDVGSMNGTVSYFKYMNVEPDIETYHEMKKVLFLETVQKHCFDKQKVKEAIEKIRNEHCELWENKGCKDSVGCCDVCAAIEDLEKELGLEE